MQPKQASYGSKPGSASPASAKGKPNVAAGGTAKVSDRKTAKSSKHVSTGTFHGAHNVAHPIKTASGPTTSMMPNC